MWLFSLIILLVVFPAGIVAVGVLTRPYSYYTTLIFGASFGLAVGCMILLVCWDFKMAVEEPEAIASEFHWVYQAFGTPALAAVSALAVRVGANLLVD